MEGRLRVALARCASNEPAAAFGATSSSTASRHCSCCRDAAGPGGRAGPATTADSARGAEAAAAAAATFCAPRCVCVSTESRVVSTCIRSRSLIFAAKPQTWRVRVAADCAVSLTPAYSVGSSSPAFQRGTNFFTKSLRGLAASSSSRKARARSQIRNSALLKVVGFGDGGNAGADGGGSFSALCLDFLSFLCFFSFSSTSCPSCRTCAACGRSRWRTTPLTQLGCSNW